MKMLPRPMTPRAVPSMKALRAAILAKLTKHAEPDRDQMGGPSDMDKDNQ